MKDILLPMTEAERESLAKILSRVYLSDFGSAIVRDAHVLLRRLKVERKR